ncbi:MAG: hypothetical protein ACRCW9_10030 [Cetobacterium sp.]
MNKQFIIKKFLEVHDEDPKRKMDRKNTNESLFLINKVNLNEVYIGIKTYINSSELAELFSFDMRNKTVKKMIVKPVSFLSKEENTYCYLYISADKRQDYFHVIDFKNDKFWKINNKASEVICSSTHGKREFDEVKKIISISFYDSVSGGYIVKEVINLNENSLMKFSSGSIQYQIDDFNVYDEDLNKIFTLDSINKKMKYLDLDLDFKTFRIIKNEYFMDNIIIKKTDNEHLLTVNFRTKKNTKKEISFYYNTKTKMFIDLTHKKGEYESNKDPLNYNAYKNELYYCHTTDDCKREIYKMNLTFNYKNSKPEEIYFNKKGIDFLSHCLNDVHKEIKYFEDFKTITCASNNTLIYSKNKKILCVYNNRTKKIFHFNYDKIFKELAHVNFDTTRNYYLFGKENKIGDMLEKFYGFYMTNKSICFEIEKKLCIEENTNYPHFRDLETVYFFFDMKSNFIIKTYENPDKNSIFNKRSLIMKHLFKNDKKMFKINNLKMIMHYNSVKSRILNNIRD